MTDPDPLIPPPAFHIERESAPEGVILLTLGGEIDLATSGRFRDVVERAAAEQATALVIDLGDVTFMDSTMLRELLRAHRDLAAAGGRVVLAAPQPAVRRLLDLTGTTAIFELADDRESAMRSVQTL